MPRSRGRRKTKDKVIPVQKDAGGLVFERLNFGRGDNREKFKEAMLLSVGVEVQNFPILLDELVSILKDRSPEIILTTFAFYGTRAAIDASGTIRRLTKDVEQHHIELLQSIILSIPKEDWGGNVPFSETIQRVFDIVPKLADTYSRRRLLENSDETDPGQRALLALQEKIRLHTQAVRNWGYFGAVKQICSELYSPLDKSLEASLGYTFSDVLDVSAALVAEIEQRGSDHMLRLGRILHHDDVEDLVRNYYQQMPNIRGNYEEFLNSIPQGTDLETVRALLMFHSDLWLSEIATCTAEEISTITGISLERISLILDILCIEPGDIKGQEIDFFFLSNPTWTKPGIRIGKAYLFPIPQAIFSHINDIIWGLAGGAGIEIELKERRAIYLEDKAVEVIQSVLPTAQIRKNVKWKVGATQYETDVLAVVDKTVVLVEAKSHRLTPPGARGALDRLKRHLREMVVAPSLQSERLAQHLIAARTGAADSQAIVKSLGLNASSIDQIIRFSLTLDDLSVLSSSEDELIDAKLAPAGHRLAPALHIADLCCIADILDEEIPFLHYFSERFHFQKHFDAFGDELDFLGVYLVTGFNLGKQRDDVRHIMFTGMSESIDKYYNALDANVIIEKPKLRICDFFHGIIKQLSSRKPNSWTTIGMHLLSSASYDEQIAITQGLNQLKKTVSRHGHKINHKCYMQIMPPLSRKATIGFYVYETGDRDLRRSRMERFVDEALAPGEAVTCVLFAKHIGDWATPYQAVLLAKKLEDGPDLRS